MGEAKTLLRVNALEQQAELADLKRQLDGATQLGRRQEQRLRQHRTSLRDLIRQLEEIEERVDGVQRRVETVSKSISRSAEAVGAQERRAHQLDQLANSSSLKRGASAALSHNSPDAKSSLHSSSRLDMKVDDKLEELERRLWQATQDFDRRLTEEAERRAAGQEEVLGVLGQGVQQLRSEQARHASELNDNLRAEQRRWRQSISDAQTQQSDQQQQIDMLESRLDTAVQALTLECRTLQKASAPDLHKESQIEGSSSKGRSASMPPLHDATQFHQDHLRGRLPVHGQPQTSLEHAHQRVHDRSNHDIHHAPNQQLHHQHQHQHHHLQHQHQHHQHLPPQHQLQGNILQSQQQPQPQLQPQSQPQPQLQLQQPQAPQQEPRQAQKTRPARKHREELKSRPDVRNGLQPCNTFVELPGTGRAPPEQLSKTQPQVTAATQQPAFDSQCHHPNPDLMKRLEALEGRFRETLPRGQGSPPSSPKSRTPVTVEVVTHHQGEGEGRISVPNGYSGFQTLPLEVRTDFAVPPLPQTAQTARGLTPPAGLMVEPIRVSPIGSSGAALATPDPPWQGSVWQASPRSPENTSQQGSGVPGQHAERFQQISPESPALPWSPIGGSLAGVRQPCQDQSPPSPNSFGNTSPPPEPLRRQTEWAYSAQASAICALCTAPSGTSRQFVST
ncbi:unnamed protein product [Effrenium voratum]|nr:unnamed protein product [Effrenium voratum]